MFPKKCKKLPSAPTSRADAQDYASVIGRALRAELGGSHRSVKTIMGWTAASERTVKNWLAGTSGPRGEHLIGIIRNSDAVFGAVLLLAGREEALTAVDLAVLRRRLVEMEADLGRLMQSGGSGP